MIRRRAGDPLGRARNLARGLTALALLSVAASGCGRAGDPPERSSSDAVARAPEAGDEPSPRPHIVLVVIDTARADHFSCYGYGQRTTPSVDALAARGILFRSAHSVAPWTLPAHMSIFTGLPPRDHGATWAAFDGEGIASVRELVTRAFTPREPARMLAARLRDSGYATHGFSPNPWVSRNKGFAEGFDTFLELWRDEDHRRALGREPRDEFERSTSGAVVLGALRALDGRATGQPVFLFLNLLDPHFPYQAPREFRERFGGSPETQRKLEMGSYTRLELGMVAGAAPFSSGELVPFYDAELATSDQAVGVLVRGLESAGVLDDTLLVVTSDHGELLGERGRFSHQLYVDEPLMHVPLVLKLPGDRGAGTVIDSPLVSNLDVYATLLAAAGVDPGPGHSRDLAGGTAPARELLIGEFAVSRAYLQQLRAVHRAFDLEAHLPGRHVVYTPGFRTELLGGRVLETLPIDPAAGESQLAAAAREAERALAAYLAAGPETRALEPGDITPDADLQRQLEALGYVGEDEDEGQGEKPAPPQPDAPRRER